MSLHKYQIDFSSLTPDEFKNLHDKLDPKTNSGLSCNPQTKLAQFLVDESIDPSHLVEIPDCCHLTRIYH